MTDRTSMKARQNRPTFRRLTIAAALLAAFSSTSCVHPMNARNEQTVLSDTTEPAKTGLAAARVARSMVGTPYRYGGSTPSGFDCSGLVLYSFKQAGRPGLPHSVARLDDLTRPVSIDALEVGDLLFFRLQGRKKSHVGIYLGDRRFVHAPSSGKKVEIVSFDHVYWGPRIELAGRLLANR